MAEKKKQSKWEKVLALGVGYVLAELLVAGLHIIPLSEVIVNYKGKKNFYEYMHKMFYVYSKEDETLGFVNKPNIDDLVTMFNIKFRYNTDNYGFRNKQHDYKKSEIAIVGDSFTYAFGVEDKDSWARKLEHFLDVDVSNFGVVGYAPWQYNGIMKRFPDFFRSKIILYCLYANDFEGKTDTPQKDYYEKKGRDYFKSYPPTLFDLVAVETAKKSFFDRTVTSTLYHRIADRTNLVLLSNGGILLKDENEIKEEWTSRENREYLHRNLSEAHKLATENGSQMIVVFFPSRLVTLSEEYTKSFQERKPIKLERELFKMAKEELVTLGLEVIDLSKSLKTEYNSEHPTYNLIDFHLSSYGNQIAAREIACSLERWGYVNPTKSGDDYKKGESEYKYVDKPTSAINNFKKEKPTLNSVVTPGIIHLDEIDF